MMCQFPAAWEETVSQVIVDKRCGLHPTKGTSFVVSSKIIHKHLLSLYGGAVTL